MPAVEREDLLEALFAAPVLPRLDLPPSLSCTEVTLAPQPRLRLLPPASANGWRLAARPGRLPLTAGRR
ncbi:MAG TPA: hypothetical protein VFE33_14925 [Thermoanaerobaculia bacterium]|nr:hypothetical protein [Thermoanaerobaculia bacterium]